MYCVDFDPAHQFFIRQSTISKNHASANPGRQKNKQRHFPFLPNWGPGFTSVEFFWGASIEPFFCVRDLAKGPYSPPAPPVENLPSQGK